MPSKPLHAFRALYATRLVRSGVDIYTVQTFLGRSDIETTQGYPYDEIASILQMEEANIRQLVSRAHKHIANGRRASVSPSEQRRLLEAFVAAAQRGDLTALEGILAEDVVSYSDGGGLVRAAGTPVSGRKRVAIFLSAVTWIWTGVTLDWVEVNRQPAVLMSRNGVPVMLGVIDASEQGINEIMWFMRPSKLAAVSRSGQRLAEGYPSGPPSS